jgi:AsmA protein
MWAVGAFAVLAAGTASFMFVAAPADLVREELIQRVKVRSGRDLTIAGPTSFSFYPSLAIAMRDVALSPPPGMRGRPAVAIELLEAKVSLWSLLQRKVEIERLMLRRPVIELRMDNEGRRTWEMAAAASQPWTRLPHAGPHGADQGQPAPDGRHAGQHSVDERNEARGGGAEHRADSERSSLVDVRIEDGTVRYFFNEPTAETSEITSLELQLGLDSLTESLAANGSLVWRAEKFVFDARLASLQTLLAGNSGSVALKLSGRPVESTYEGTLRLGSPPQLDGALTIKAPSLSGLAQWLELMLPGADGMGPLALSTRLETRDAAGVMTDLDLTFDRTAATGSISLETKGARPYIKADLQISELDLKRLALLQKPVPPQDSTPPEGGMSVPSFQARPTAIEDRLRQSESGSVNADRRFNAHANGFAQRPRWSETEIDLSVLGRIDADASLAIRRVIFHELKLGQTQMTLALKNRVLAANFDDVQLYDGRGRGNLSIDATGKVLAVGAKLALEGISALPLLKDAAGFGWITGSGEMTIAVRGQGQSQRQIVESLAGKAEFALNDGAVVGIDIPKFVRRLQKSRIAGLDRAGSEKTSFRELAGTFMIENGIVQNRDLRLASPLVHVAGAGTISLPARQLDYTLRPKLAGNLSGHSGGQALAGVELPMKITGPWDHPRVAADIGAVVKDPNQIVETAKQLRKQLKGKSVEEAVRTLLGSGPGREGTALEQPGELSKQLPKAE